MEKQNISCNSDKPEEQLFCGINLNFEALRFRMTTLNT